MLKYFIFSSVLLACVPRATNQFFGNTFDLGNLGNSITNMVNENLAQAGILPNRGRTGKHQNFQKSLHEQIMEETSVFEENMNKWSDKLQSQMHDMQLKLTAPQVKLSMLKGIGGSSIIEYGHNNVIIANNNEYVQCLGSIVLPGGRNRSPYISCNGNVIPINKDDPCIPGTMKIRFNNIYCIGDQANLVVVNDNASCKNGIIYNRSQLENKCGPKFGTNNYAFVKYYPDIESLAHISIPNSNKYVQCLNYDNSHCEFFTNDNGIIL